MAGLVVAAAVLVNLLAAGAEPLPPVDLALPIDLPDGSRLPLGEVLERARRGLPPIPHAIEPVASAPDEPTGLAQVFLLARRAADAGQLDQALVLYLSIPPGDANYARSRRLAGWNILGRDRREPARAGARRPVCQRFLPC